MYDSVGIQSKAVRYELEYVEEYSYKLNVIADSEWINDTQREFPITIDPTIEMVNSAENIKITEKTKINNRIKASG